jgi:hypothetical protein
MTMAGDDAYSGRAVVQIESARYPVTVVWLASSNRWTVDITGVAGSCRCRTSPPR